MKIIQKIFNIASSLLITLYKIREAMDEK